MKKETLAVYFAARHTRTPWYARLVAVCIVGYALSPIDLIPDFIPVLGLLDDLILIPLGIALVIRLIPAEVLAECRARATAEMLSGKPTNWSAAALVIVVWIALAALGFIVVWRLFG